MVALVALAALPLAIASSDYLLGVAVLGLAYAGYGVGFNIIFGETDQLFLCVGALAGLGAYGTTIVANGGDLPPVVAALLAVAAAALVGGALSWVSVRRRLGVIFVGIITLTTSLVFESLLLGQRGLTGGETGIVATYVPGVVGARGVGAFYVVLAVVGCCLAVHLWLQRSHVGWAFRALRDDPLAAALTGVDVTRYKVLAGVVGSAIIGLNGALFAAHERFVAPASFDLGSVDVPVLLLLAFGGIGRLLAPVVGAAAFVVIDEAIRPVGALRDAVYGVILLALFLGFRRGLLPAVAALGARVRGGRGGS